MEMDAMEEEFTGSSTDHTMIVKRKRTKRSRQVSSLNAIVTSSSSSDGGGGGGGAGEGDGSEIRFLVPSISISSEISTSTEEDEDMANCLILLAQSGCSSTQVDQEEVKIEKISSRRFTEMATTTGKAGIYVYECKTCNRSFPSFQALGGHRASHKKSKIAMVDEKKVSITTSNDHHHQEEEEKHEDTTSFDVSCIQKKEKHEEEKFTIPIQLANKKGKIHECSICGSEFSSGQALGGHMRRHRNIPTSKKDNNTNIDTSTTTETSSHDGGNRGERPRNILQLDLNLPAPVEDDHDHHDSKFQFSANQQQHVFSSPALVDCHY